MHNTTRLILLLCSSLFAACNNAPESQNATNPTAAETITRSPEALRKTYTEQLALQKSPLPVKQIQSAGKLYPVDEAPLDTAFFVFRQDLLDIVARKDAHTLLAYVDPHIKCGFGAENGMPDFVRQWNLDNPTEATQSPLWQHLESVLQHGGVFDATRKRFSAPYVAATFPDKYDALDHGAIIAKEVRMREGAGLGGKVIKNISYEIVKILERSATEDVIDGRSYPWFKVRTTGGTEGWVYGQFVGLPAGFRANFEQQGSQWRMVLFLAGD